MKNSLIWEEDERKINLANEYNYKVLVVWESEYKNDKDNIIEKCKTFLNI